MKKLLSIIVCLSLAYSSFAQGFMSRAADRDFGIEISDYFTFEPLSYFNFGFNSLTNDQDNFGENTSFFRSQEFAFNMLELSFLPYDGGCISIGADVNWNWYHLNKDLMWIPYSGTFGIPQENGDHVGVVPKELAPVSDVKRSVLSVATFSFPIGFTQKFGRIALMVGVSPELNLKGRTEFRGTMMDGSQIKETKSGLRFSNKINTNLFTYNIHAAISYGGLGLYVKYRPKPQFAEGYGPQFNTWTFGMVIGIGM